jgi:hypothetical protein
MGEPALDAEAPAKKSRFVLRPLLRAIHRDAGYLAVGLTLVYALSGLAVNHIAAWDPNFRNYETTHHLGPIVATASDDAMAKEVREKLGVTDEPREVYRVSPDQLDILFEHRTLHVSPKTGDVFDEGQKPRFLLRVANWLHLNRGKKAWTYVADTYAAALLFLAISGMFMIKGPKGLLGRGAALVLLGIAIPTAYVVLSGGP